MALPFLTLYLTQSLGFSTATAGGAIGTYGAIALLVGPVAGRFADRWGSLRMTEGSLLASGLVLMAFPLAKSLPAVIGIIVLFALSNEAGRPAMLTLVGKFAVHENRKAAFALNRLAVNLGMSFGVAAGGFLAKIAFPAVFLVDGATTLVALAMLLMTSFHKSVKGSEIRTRAEHVVARENSGVTAPKRGLFDTLVYDNKFRLFLFGVIPAAQLFFQHQSTLPLFLVRSLHFSEATYGILFSLNTLLIITLEIPLNSVTSHWSHRRALGLGTLLMAVGFGALAFATSRAAVAATIVVWTFGEMMLFPALTAFITEVAPAERKGEYMGLFTMTFSFGFMTGPWIGALVLDHFGSTTLWAACFCVGMLAATILSSKQLAVPEAAKI